MHCITPNRRTLSEVEVVDFEKRRNPSKHYVYIINVSWSDGSETVIYRRYSMFFDFQIILLETFPWEGGLKEPSARKIPFLPGKILFRRSHIRDVAQKRLKPINEYCKALVKLPKHISHCDHVLDFFEVRPDDVNPIRDDPSRLRTEDQVPRSRLHGVVRRTKSLNISEISGPLFLEPYVAIADHFSSQQKELSITEGERLEVIEKNENGWWLVSNDEGERGWVPGVYLERPDGASEDLVTQRDAPGQGEQYITTQAYTAENCDEISFGTGVTVEVLQKNLEGWWLIRYNGKQGNAPAPYLEKQQNWMLPNKVEIISSIHDLKRMPSNSSNIHTQGHSVNTSQISTSAGAFQPREPASPLSPTSSYRGIVLPTPKRSTIKRTTKRPNAPPPLPPAAAQEQTYEYLTIASFNASIPDGVSFGEDKKVQVLEKSPGGWWFVKVEGREGWAPASYIEKREATKSKPAGPTRPNLPTIQKSNSTATRKNGSSARPTIRKNSLNSITISHPILQNVSSVPADSSPAKRPLPPVPPSTKPSIATTVPEDTYEDIKDPKSSGNGIRPVVTRTDSNISPQKEPTKIDFRSHLKSNLPSRHAIQPNLSKAPARPPSFTGDQRKMSNPPKPATNRYTAASACEKGSKPVGFKNFEKMASQFKENTESSKNPVLSNTSIPARPNRTEPPKKLNIPPSLPVKPKPPSTAVKPKIESKDDGVVTDFRSVLRSAQNKSSSSQANAFRSHDVKKSWNGNPSTNKGPSVPKKPLNVPLKPPSSRLNGPAKGSHNGASSDAASSSGVQNSTGKPQWKPGDKPVLRRFQQNNNSNVKESNTKQVFTVAHARFELKNRPDFIETLSKRGSPDGQADFKFESTDSKIPVSPPERKKKLLKSMKKDVVSKQKVANNIDSEKFVIAISDYTGQGSTEVSFFCGDKLQVLDEAESEWWYVKIGENMGWAPSSFLSDISDNHSNVFASHQSNNTDSCGYDSVYSEIENDPHRPRFPAQFTVLADFQAQDQSMVNLAMKDIVTVTQEAQGGWWYVTHIDGREGWVPSTYLEPV